MKNTVSFSLCQFLCNKFLLDLYSPGIERRFSSVCFCIKPPHPKIFFIERDAKNLCIHWYFIFKHPDFFIFYCFIFFKKYSWKYLKNKQTTQYVIGVIILRFYVINKIEIIFSLFAFRLCPVPLIFNLSIQYSRS